jgi:hypothetical protein
MLGMPILDVALGMIFLYLLLSLVCTSIVEFVAGLTKKRARLLTEGIVELFDDPAVAAKVAAAGEQVTHALPTAEAFFEHPLVRSLYRTAGDGDRVSLDNKGNKPSYIPARTFALTLLDMVARPQTHAEPAQGVGAGNAAGPPAQAAPAAKPVDVAQTAAQQIRELADAVSRLPAGSYLRKTLEVLISEARGDMVKVQENVEIWYNHAMDRVSGWYKRWSQIFIFCLSLGLAFAVNADSISIAQELSTNSALRQALAAQAEAYAKKPDAGQTQQDSSVAAIRASVKELNSLGVSLGWTDDDWKTRDAAQRLLKIAGLLLTGFAVSLGAPFWFDMLNKIVTIRTAGKSPEDKPKSPEGGPKRKEEAPPE